MWQRHIFASSLPPSGGAAVMSCVAAAWRGAAVPGCGTAEDGGKQDLETDRERRFLFVISEHVDALMQVVGGASSVLGWEWKADADTGRGLKTP